MRRNRRRKLAVLAAVVPSGLVLPTSRLQQTVRVGADGGFLLRGVSEMVLERLQRKNAANDASVVGKEERAHAAQGDHVHGADVAQRLAHGDDGQFRDRD